MSDDIKDGLANTPQAAMASAIRELESRQSLSGVKHARVIAIQSEWRLGSQSHRLGLKLSDGTLVAMPWGLHAQPGDVLAVVSVAEWELLVAYRDNTKEQQS